jgi:hypothetical protein
MELTNKQIEERLGDGRLEKLHPQVWVFRGGIKNPETLLEKIKALPDWKDWWVFGHINDTITGPDATWDDFPEQEEWDNHLQSSGGTHEDIRSEIENYCYSATKLYKEDTGFDLDNWMHQTPSICVYREEGGVSDKMSMHYHTDYQSEKAEARGFKFKLTCTMYLNDDYEGGELAFVIRNNREDDSSDIRFDYKPTAGDILIFPSTAPFYHGVKTLRVGDRWFIRNFWLEYFPGTPEWLAGEAQYGEEEWAKMEKEREKEFIRSLRTIH